MDAGETITLRLISTAYTDFMVSMVYGQYGFMIIDYMTNAVVAGSRYDLSLDDVREYIAE